MPVPYTMAPAVGVAVVFVPPLAIGTVPRLRLGVAPPLDEMGLDAVTDVTVPVVGVVQVGVPAPADVRTWPVVPAAEKP